MPELPWKGRHVAVAADGAVSWRRCAVCNRPLSDPESVARGVGPDCALEHDDQEQDDARAMALDADRSRWSKEAREEKRAAARERWAREARERDRAAGRVLHARRPVALADYDPNWVPPWRRVYGPEKRS